MILRTPSPISSLAYAGGHLFAGSDDGSMRVYGQSSPKVLKAIRGLGSEISSIVPVHTTQKEIGDVWLACGQRVLLFDMDLTKLIMSPADAQAIVELCSEKDDVLNELALSGDQKHLAFTQDSGLVGVVHLDTKVVSRMTKKHSSICSTVSFIPGRSSELVSGGYDHTLLHFNFSRGTLLSERNLAGALSEELSTPLFITDVAISSSGLVAAGVADGRLWIGLGGQKISNPPSKKKNIKWRGLREEDELFVRLAEGPIVVLAFVDSAMLLFCTLLGKTVQCRIHPGDKFTTPNVEVIWTRETEHVAKVNALTVNESCVSIGGLDQQGRGIIEIWDRDKN